MSFNVSSNCLSQCNFLSPENITAGATVILAIITGFYAISTYKMVKISQKEFEISNRPYILVAAIGQEIKDDIVTFSVTIKNSGKIPAILVESEVIGFNENQSERNELSKNSSQVIINPGEILMKDLTAIDLKIPGINFIEFTIKYKSPAQDKTSYFTKYIYKYDSNVGIRLTIVESTSQ